MGFTALRASKVPWLLSVPACNPENAVLPALWADVLDIGRHVWRLGLCLLPVGE